MAGTRTVYRGSRGRFAGASAGKPQKVKAGGFANAAFQARFQAQRKMAPARTSSASAKKTAGSRGARFKPNRTIRNEAKRAAKRAGKAGLKAGVTIGVTAGTAAIAANVVRGGGIKISATGMIGVRKAPTNQNLNGVLRLASGARIPHNINFNNPPKR